MLGIQILTALVFAATSVPKSVASPVELSERDSVGQQRSWPDSGLVVREAAPTVRRATNAERIQRGLAPLTPARLYDSSRVHSAPVARLSSTPNSPSISAGGIFDFYDCFGAVTGTTGTVDIEATSDQDAVNQCSTSNTIGSWFAVKYDAGDFYTCYYNAHGSGSSQTCTQTNYAVYEYYD